MYRIDDEVRLMVEGKLVEDMYVVIEHSDDEEVFELKNIETGETIKDVKRENIMEDYEVDKLIINLVKANLVEVNEDEVEELEDDEVIIAPDATIDGLAMNFNSFSDIDEANQWWSQYVDYVQYDKDNDMYHVLTMNI